MRNEEVLFAIERIITHSTGASQTYHNRPQIFHKLFSSVVRQSRSRGSCWSTSPPPQPHLHPSNPPQQPPPHPMVYDCVIAYTPSYREIISEMEKCGRLVARAAGIFIKFLKRRRGKLISNMCPVLPGSKSAIKSHYRGHKISIWLNLIPQLHQPGLGVFNMQHHHFQEEALQYYDGE